MLLVSCVDLDVANVVVVLLVVLVVVVDGYYGHLHVVKVLVV